MKKKKTLLTLVATALLFTSLTLLADDFRENWRTEFIEGCVSPSSTKAQCACVADNLLNAYPERSIKDFTDRLLSNKGTEEDKAIYVKALVSCHK